MKFSLILLGLSWLLRYTAWRNPVFRARLKEKNFVAQIKIADDSLGRYFSFQDGKVSSQPVIHHSPEICMSFKSAEIAAQLLMPPVDYQNQIDAQKEFNDLKTGDTSEAKIIDDAIKEINKATEFVEKAINSNNNIEAIKALEFIEKSLSGVSALVPQEFSSDMSKADMSTFGEDKTKMLISVTEDMKNKKEEKLNELITNMVDLNKTGLASFEIAENLKKIGVDTIQFEVALRTSAVDLEKKLDSIPLQTNQLYNQKSALLDQAEEMAKQDWVGYEEEHAQFDNQILEINKKLADIEKSDQ